MRPWNAACLLILLILLPLAAPAATLKAPIRLQPTPAATVALARRQPARMETLSPSLRQWVDARARATVARGGDPDVAAIRSDARARLAGQVYGDADIEALAFLVLMQASRQAQDDLREIMDQVKDANQAKAGQREAARSRTALAAQARLDYAHAIAPAAPATVAAPARADGIGDLGEHRQLQLQLAMDRKAKLEQALSNLMKKSSDTAATISGNLK
jgi:hypothetical protein